MSKSDNETQQNYIEAQILTSHFQQLQEQVSLISNQVNEISHQLEYLDEFRKVKLGSTILAQILPGVFIKAKLQDENQLVVNVGSNISITKSIEETKEILNKRIRELKDAEANLGEQLLAVIDQLNKRQHLLQ